MTHDRALQMRVGVVFARLMVTIVETRRRELLEPLLKIVDQPVFPVVDVHTGRDVHRRDEHGAVLDSARLNDGGDLVRDADELLPLPGVERQIVGMNDHVGAVALCRHSARAASALRSVDALAPARKFRSPAAAIIAALSVDSARLGRNVGISRRAPRSASSARRRLLADTPPAMPTLFAW